MRRISLKDPSRASQLQKKLDGLIKLDTYQGHLYQHRPLSRLSLGKNLKRLASLRKMKSPRGQRTTETNLVKRWNRYLLHIPQ